MPLAASIMRSALPRSQGGPARPTVSLSLLGAVDLPEVAPATRPILACATMGPAAGTFVFVVQVGPAITISLWDDTGAFDLPRFPAAFASEVERRTRG